jgi:transcriptional regulator with XRE-family HTH domain
VLLAGLCRKIWQQQDFTGYASVVEDTGEPQGTSSRPVLPERVITPNMLAAFNMARLREASGWTQARLGEEIGGWTKGAVSAAERSWDGKKVRQFDADLIATLASIFHVPFSAFFLPPPDDGVTARYVIGGEDGPVPMDAYFGYAMSEPDFEPIGPASAEYRRAYITAVGRYAEGADREELGEAVSELAGAAQIESVLKQAQQSAERLDGLYGTVDDLRAENAILQQALEHALRKRKQ